MSSLCRTQLFHLHKSVVISSDFVFSSLLYFYAICRFLSFIPSPHSFILCVCVVSAMKTQPTVDVISTPKLQMSSIVSLPCNQECLSFSSVLGY